MDGNKCVILIGEDEEIEREAIQEIILTHFKDSVRVILAKNGKEAVAQYQRYHADIVLMDINMPVMNGLEAIEIMREEKQETIYLILTSYDAFSYAQKAIQLGVEAFLLKPAKGSQIIHAVSKALGKVHIQHNEDSQASMLVEKFKEMQPILELQCLYTILSNSNEVTIQKELRKLNIQATTGFCFIVSMDHSLKQDALHVIKEDICDLGYACIYGYMNHLYIFFVLSSIELKAEDLQILEYVLAHHHLQKMKIGIGSVQRKLENFYTSYLHAMRDVHQHQEHEPLSIAPFTGSIVMQKEADEQSLVEALLQCFLKQDETRLPSIVHGYSASLLLKDSKEISKEVETMIDQLIVKLEKQYQVLIERSALPQFYVTEDQKYQNLEVQLLYLLSSLFRPLKQTSYQQSNQLVKKAMVYISQNFRKPIGLQDVAKQLQVSPFYVSKLLKQYNDKNFTDLLSEYRIEEAKHCLQKGERVKEVAFAVGFQSQSYFAKTFKKMVGLTPKEYQAMFF